MNFSIRQLQDDDLDNGSFLKTLSNLSDTEGIDANQAKEIYQRAKQAGIYFLVAISDEGDNKGEVISTVKLIVEPKFYHGGQSAGHIECVATRIGFEGRGLSKALLAAAIKIAKDNNCYKVILDCKKELIPFYAKLGFREHDVCMRLDF